MWVWDRKVRPMWSPFVITRQASWCHTVILWTDLLLLLLHPNTTHGGFLYCLSWWLPQTSVQWATLVTHHFFRVHIFWQKCWNRTFSMIIYLLTFYLFDNIEKKILESLMRIILLLKGNFDKFWKIHVQAERPYFLFLFCVRHYPWWSLWQKNTKNNLFIQVKPLFLVVEFSNTVTFYRNARFNVILTSVTIIKLGFLRKLFCNESLVNIEVSKH